MRYLGMSYRAMFLLTLWNDRTLQGPGFAWTVNAGVGEVNRVSRDAAGFNTTPAMAPCVIGAVVRMESDGASPEDVTRVKDSGAASLAAVGDQLFWGLIRPSAALAGLVAWQLGPLVSAAALLAVQGLPQLAFRLLGLARGLGRGKSAIPEFIGAARRAFRVASPVGSALAGLFAGAVLSSARGTHGPEGAIVVMAATAGFVWLMSSRLASPSAICLATLALSGILSLLVGS
jgi:mannose/fructose/N-acetylgalactosamine-specific phosphotransferase system component IID